MRFAMFSLGFVAIIALLVISLSLWILSWAVESITHKSVFYKL